ncbi:MAG: glycosyltransferase family 9 protein [Bacteroidales bacterium]|nr:glycosyltransferase family 9 protein [Bacteroidales bacterium]
MHKSIPELAIRKQQQEDKRSLPVSSDKWIEHMRQGDFENAWKFSDMVLKSGINRDYQTQPRHFQCIWDGTPLVGKRVLIRCYHGLGDTIQFIRYAPLVKSLAREVIVWAQPSLFDLLKSVSGIDRLLPLHNGNPEAEYDVDIEIMELPHVFRTVLSTIPSRVPYLFADPVFLNDAQTRLSVGLVWRAGDWDQSRNIPFSLLKPMFGLQNVDIYILQANARAAGWEKGWGIHPGEFGILDYARIIKGLDLIISVDSMPAHLAGALGAPVWVMLRKFADWRWMEHRMDSPWYPSMKLFRQKNEGNWDGMIAEVMAALKNFK